MGLSFSSGLCVCLSATLACHRALTVGRIDLKLGRWDGLPSAPKVKVKGQGHLKVKVV